ncbi:MAG: hypothetical protein SVC26_07300 [Pseudomonadota bacterium]|nr:hypothetical protein [Pseudomonadota bacterium]
MHRQVDLIIELPAFTGVVTTGACLALAEYTQFSWLMWLKVSLGISAIVLNMYCVWQVLRREHFSQHAHWSSFDLANQRQRMAGIMVIALVLLTLLLAII